MARACAFGDKPSTYVGIQFEAICLQWLIRQNNKGELPFLATWFGKWWGTDPSKREQTDIDVIVANPQEKRIIVGECKYRNSFNETEAFETLEKRAALIKDCDVEEFVLFSKHPLSDGTRRKVDADKRLHAVCLNDLYER